MSDDQYTTVYSIEMLEMLFWHWNLTFEIGSLITSWCTCDYDHVVLQKEKVYLDPPGGA